MHIAMVLCIVCVFTCASRGSIDLQRPQDGDKNAITIGRFWRYFSARVVCVSYDGALGEFPMGPNYLLFV